MPESFERNLEDLLKARIFGELQLDRSGRRRLENGALAEELARAAPTFLEIHRVFLGGFAVGKALSNLLENADGVTVRRVEPHGEIELHDRFFQLFSGEAFLALLHVISGGLDESALESQAIFDVARVLVDGARVEHDGRVPFAFLAGVAAFSMSAATGSTGENAESDRHDRQKEPCVLWGSSHVSSVGLKRNALGSARSSRGNGHRFEADLDHGESVGNSLAFGARENLVAVEKNRILGLAARGGGLLDEARIFHVRAGAGTRRLTRRGRWRWRPRWRRPCRRRWRSGAPRRRRLGSVDEEIAPLSFVLGYGRQHGLQVELGVDGLPPSASTSWRAPLGRLRARRRLGSASIDERQRKHS